MGILSKKKYISLAASVILVGSIGFTGCGGGGGSSATVTEDTSDEQTVDNRIVSGPAIDGYLKGANVTLNSISATTDDNGIWKVIYTPKETDEDIVSVTGGIDISTGEIFEGVLEASAATEQGESVVVSPLSTLVSSLVKKGDNPVEATQNVADSLGLHISILNADPIALLSTGSADKKAKAASAIKKALIVQKVIESLTTSLVDMASDDSDSIFLSITDVVVARLTDGEAKFDAVMADTSSITDDVVTSGAVEHIENASEKLAIAADATTTIVDAITAIDENDLVNAKAENVMAVLETKSKAIEIVTESIEKKLEIVSKATNSTELSKTEENVQETSKALVMLGGVEGLATKLDNQAKTVDASTFGENFITQEIIDSQSKTYDTLIDIGLNIDAIMEVGTDISASDDNSANTMTQIIEAVVKKAVDNGTIEKGLIDTTSIKSIADEVSKAATGVSKAAADAAAKAATEGSKAAADAAA